MTESSVKTSGNISEPDLNTLTISLSDHTADLTDFQTWILSNYKGALKVLREKSEAVSTERPLIIAFHHFKKYSIKLKFWCDHLHQVAVIYKGSVDFAVADLSSFCLLRELSVFDYGFLHEREKPWVFAIDKQNRYFEMTKNVSIESLKSFADELLQSKLFRSEPLPPVQDSVQPIKIAVAKYFDELVYENDKDVFIVFYAPWCSFSKELLPRLEDLANMLQDDEDQLIIVKIDAEANYIAPHFGVFAFPTCFFLTKNFKNRFIKYDRGPRTINNLIAFIAYHSSEELQRYDRKGILKSKKTSN